MSKLNAEVKFEERDVVSVATISFADLGEKLYKK